MLTVLVIRAIHWLHNLYMRSSWIGFGSLVIPVVVFQTAWYMPCSGLHFLPAQRRLAWRILYRDISFPPVLLVLDLVHLLAQRELHPTNHIMYGAKLWRTYKHLGLLIFLRVRGLDSVVITLLPSAQLYIKGREGGTLETLFFKSITTIHPSYKILGSY